MHSSTYEVAVIAITSGITVCEHERLLVAIPHILEALCIIIDFVEKCDKVYRVTRGATTAIVVPIFRVRNVGFVV